MYLATLRWETFFSRWINHLQNNGFYMHHLLQHSNVRYLRVSNGLQNKLRVCLILWLAVLGWSS
jgi:hypothetical protein